MKTVFSIAGVILILVLSLRPTLLRAADQPPKYTVQEIMKAVFKGDDSIAKRVGKGKATQAEVDKLAEYVGALPVNDAPQGDPAGWKKKTTAVLEAVTALQAGKPGAVAQFNLAVDCKACHSVYRPTD